MFVFADKRTDVIPTLHRHDTDVAIFAQPFRLQAFTKGPVACNAQRTHLGFRYRTVQMALRFVITYVSANMNDDHLPDRRLK